MTTITSPTTALETFKQYSQLITTLIANPTPFTPETEDDLHVQVERGEIFPLTLLDPQNASNQIHVSRLIDLARWEIPHHVTIVDRARHIRPAYRPLLIYSWLQAFRLAYETLPRAEFGQWEEGLRPWCDDLEVAISAVPWPTDSSPASIGDQIAQACWSALALHVAGKIFIRDAWTDIASDTFGRLTKRQQPNGAFLQRADTESLDLFWYHELVILQAAASFAVQTEDRPLAAAVQRNSTFHFEQTQPDHATTQPWALFAFIWNPQTKPHADQLLHAMQLQHPVGIDKISLMLLADALYCMRLFI